MNRISLVNQIRVTHIITDLNVGGAETMLYRLIEKGQDADFHSTVISLTDGGSIAEKLKDIKIAVHALNIGHNSLNPFKIFELRNLLRQQRPDVVQSWMYHADLLGGVAAKMGGRVPVIWGIRNSTLDSKLSNARTIKLVKVNAKLAKYLPDAIVANSKIAMAVHVGLGYPKNKFRIIPNGYDTEEFAPNPNAYSSVRNELNLPKSASLIGLIGRFDPQKDHQTFIQAAEILFQKRSDVHYLMAGSGISWDNPILLEQINHAGLADNFHLLGLRNDIPKLMASLNILTSVSTYGESFPNVVAEAMACGVPCVVTDVGDSAYIVEGTGKVVSVRNPFAVAQAWGEFLQLSQQGRIAIGRAARNRIISKFEIKKMVDCYHKLYLEVGDRKSRGKKIYKS